MCSFTNYFDSPCKIIRDMARIAIRNCYYVRSQVTFFKNHTDFQIYNTITNMKTAQVAPKSEEEYTQDDQSRLFSKFIDKVGPFGKYQKTILMIMCISSCITAQSMFITPFLTYQDPYQCTNLPKDFGNCKDYVCSLPAEQRQTFIPLSTMRTLSTKFGDFRCSQEYKTINFVVFIMYSGNIVAYLILSVAGDYFGRKTFLVTGLALGLVGLIPAIFANNIYVAAVGLMLCSIGIQTQYSINLNIISEIVGQQKRQSALVFYQVAFSLGYLVDTGLFYWLQDYQTVLIYFFIVPLAVILALHLCIIVETPIILITNKTAQQALQGLQWMAKVNGVSCPDITLELIVSVKMMHMQREEENQQTSRFTILDLFKFGSLRLKTVLLIIVQIAISFLFYAPNLMLDDFNTSIFVSGILMGGSNFISGIVCLFSISCFRRKTIAFVSFAIILACSMVLVFIFHPSGSLSISQNISVLILMFLMSFCITYEYTAFVVYQTELYPTQVRVIGLSVMNLVANVTLAVSSFIIEGVSNAGFSIMIIFSILALVSIVGSMCLPQTFEVAPKDLVLELSRQVISSDTKIVSKTTLIQIQSKTIGIKMEDQFK